MNTGSNAVIFDFVTRRSGGEWLRVAFDSSAYVDYVALTVIRASVVIHEAYLVTASGRRIPLTSFTYAGVISAVRVVQSSYITAGERISAIDLRAESMGSESTLSVSVQSSGATPRIRAVRN